MPTTDKRVLVFDDDQDLLTIFRFLFEDHGWEVHTSESCGQAVELAHEFKPNLILMDNWIPPAGGMEATKLLKADNALSNTPVIYISANNDVRDLSEKAGADAYMAKPFDFDALIALAENLAKQ